MHLSALLQFSVSTDCSIREYQSIFKFNGLKYLPNMLSLCWHSTPAYYAFYHAGIFDVVLAMERVEENVWNESYIRIEVY